MHCTYMYPSKIRIHVTASINFQVTNQGYKQLTLSKMKEPMYPDNVIIYGAIKEHPFLDLLKSKNSHFWGMRLYFKMYFLNFFCLFKSLSPCKYTKLGR